MAIIVSGKICIKPGLRETFIERSRRAVTAARQTAGCLDFAVSPDIIEKNRVNIFEKWRSRNALLAFRENGPEDEIASLIEVIQIDEDEVEKGRKKIRPGFPVTPGKVVRLVDYEALADELEEAYAEATKGQTNLPDYRLYATDRGQVPD